jgi:hypothetical protein
VDVPTDVKHVKPNIAAIQLLEQSIILGAMSEKHKQLKNMKLS